jgi:hypothetical protein
LGAKSAWFASRSFLFWPFFPLAHFAATAQRQPARQNLAQRVSERRVVNRHHPHSQAL